MTAAEACISAILGILTIAYPLFIGAIGRLDDRFDSTIVADLFKKEPAWEYFTAALYAALIAIGLHFGGIFLIRQISGAAAKSCPFISYLFDLPLYFTTICLTVCLINFVPLILDYYSAQKLVTRFEAASKNDKGYLYFQAMADILFIAIKREDETLVNSLREYFGSRFAQFRASVESGPVVYPDIFYDLQYRIIRDVTVNKSYKLNAVGYSATNGTWLLGAMEQREISEKTYQWLWYNIVFIVEHDRDELFFSYWQMAEQYVTFDLGLLPRRSKFVGDKIVFENEAAVNQRRKEHDRFLEFHIAIGGLLLYRRRYDWLMRLFRFSNNNPPSYNLLPGSFSTIIRWYLTFNDNLHSYLWLIRSRYSFPQTEGILADDLIREWISDYLAILLLRLYNLPPHSYGGDYLAMATVPESQLDKHILLQEIPYFASHLNKVIKDMPVLQQLKLDGITKHWCIWNSKEYPTNLVENYLKKIKLAYSNKELTQEVDNDKVTQYKDASLRAIKPLFESYQAISNPNPVNNDFQESFLRGNHHFVEKSMFVMGQPIDYITFDTIMGEIVRLELSGKISRIINGRVATSYLIKSAEFGAALSRLQLDAGRDIVISCGIDKDRLLHQLSTTVVAIQADNIVELPPGTYDPDFFYQCILILPKEMLPVFSYRELPAGDIKKYTLNRYDEEFRIYGAVLDLYKNSSIKSEFNNTTDKDLDRSVMLLLDFNLSIRWRNNSRIVKLAIYDNYMDDHSPDNVADIIPL